jgi:hypothetical protein
VTRSSPTAGSDVSIHFDNPILLADDRIPVAVRHFLILRCDLEGKGLGVPERRAAVETN